MSEMKQAGKIGVVPGKVRKAGEKQMTEMNKVMAALRDHGQTMVWEIFAGESNMTEMAVRGGHHAGEKVDKRYGLDLSTASS